MQNIIKDVRLITITSCVMQCSNMTTCATIGLKNDPNLLENDRCYLLKKQNKESKKGPDMKLLFVVVDVSFSFSFLLSFSPLSLHTKLLMSFI